MEQQYILSLDQGTTSSRAIVYDHSGQPQAIAHKEYAQHFPKPTWVEHDAVEIWSSQISVASEVIAKMGISPKRIAALGITNQRETTILWNRKTGKPIYNAIVWQDRRTSSFCNNLKKSGHENQIKEKTGLEIDPYFSATKIKWILDEVSGARAMADKGLLAFGTVETWLIWNLSNGKSHITDVSNASRTMLFNIHTLDWDEDLLNLFSIPKSILPEVVANSGLLATTSGRNLNSSIPITGVAGDQQAAMFGQLCVEKGMVKNTYGTGCFLMMNTGHEAVISEYKLLTTVAWQLNGQTTYALEGSVFTAGAVVQWLRDGLGLIKDAKAIGALATSVSDNGGVYFVPAFTGLGAPHWNPDAKAMIYGLSRGSTQAHIARAALEAIAYQSYDVIKAMEQDTDTKIQNLRVDGGASANDFLMQFQSDLIQEKVERPSILETTSLGAAYFAGLAVGFWSDLDDIASQWKLERAFLPKKDKRDCDLLIAQWHEAVKRVF